MFKNFLINCDQATTICDKSQYGEAAFTEKLKLKWHLLVCSICKTYVKQNNTMTSIYKIKSVDSKNVKRCLSDKDKEALKAELEKIKA